MTPQYTFVWWGDGYFVYKDGGYIGKDDQLDLVEIMVELGADVKTVPNDWEDWGAADPLSDFKGLRDGFHDVEVSE